eukprot:707021-Ditylum_brightwellii.AAC.1
MVVTSKWTLLDQNDTIPAGLYIKVDLTTGQKWGKLWMRRKTVIQWMQFLFRGDKYDEANSRKKDIYNYTAMHQAISNLPSEKKEQMG